MVQRKRQREEATEGGVRDRAHGHVNQGYLALYTNRCLECCVSDEPVSCASDEPVSCVVCRVLFDDSPPFGTKFVPFPEETCPPVHAYEWRRLLGVYTGYWRGLGLAASCSHASAKFLTAWPHRPLSKLAAARCRLAFGLALACDGLVRECPAACLDVDVMPLLLSRVRTVTPLTDKTIREAVDECVPHMLIRDSEGGRCPGEATSWPRGASRRHVVVRDGPRTQGWSRTHVNRAVWKWGRIVDWDVSQVVSMSGLFYRSPFFNADIGDWDVGAVQDMSAMFEGAGSFDRDLSRWNVGAVKDTTGIFTACPMEVSASCNAPWAATRRCL